MARSKAEKMLTEFGELMECDSQIGFFDYALGNRESVASGGLEFILRRLSKTAQGKKVFGEIISLGKAGNARQEHRPANLVSLEKAFRTGQITVDAEKLVKVGRTKGQQKRRFDFLLAANGKYGVVVEVKVDAVDSRDQIAAYFKYLDNEYGQSGGNALIYLTPEGAMPYDENKKISPAHLSRILPVSWNALAGILERHLGKLKNVNDEAACRGFLEYMECYNRRSPSAKIYQWVMPRLGDIAAAWAEMKNFGNDSAFSGLQSDILGIVGKFYAHIADVLRKKGGKTVVFDDLLPKTAKLNFGSYPVFYEQEWLGDDDAATFYYVLEADEKHTTPPRALGNLLHGDIAVALVCDKNFDKKTCAEIRKGIAGAVKREPSGGKARRWRMECLYRFPVGHFTTKYLNAVYSGKDAPDGGDVFADKVAKFWDEHRKIRAIVGEYI